MTLQQMASAVRNHVLDGLNGQDSSAFSMEQLEDEILQVTPTVIITMVTKGLIDINKLTQRIDGIRVECKDISANCAVETEECAPHFTIPNINRAAAEPISFLGSIDSLLTFKIYFDRDYRFHKYRLATNKAPFAWVSSTANTEGTYDVFLFNLGKYNNIKFLSIDALFDDPHDLLDTEYYSQFSTAEFYAPKFVQSQVIDTLTQKYVNYYRQLHMNQKPNIQQS